MGFLHSKTDFKTCFFLEQDGRARKGWNKILNEKKMFLAFTSKLFNPDVLFTHSAARQGWETPFTSEKACLSVRCCPQRQSDVAVSVWGGKALPGVNCPWQWAADASVCHSAFVSSSPPFTSSPSLPLLPAPTKGKSSFTLLLSPVAAMATLCFVAEIYRKKTTSDSLAGFVWEAPWSLRHSALRLA